MTVNASLALDRTPGILGEAMRDAGAERSSSSTEEGDWEWLARR
jgi:hypothetical protein